MNQNYPKSAPAKRAPQPAKSKRSLPTSNSRRLSFLTVLYHKIAVYIKKTVLSRIRSEVWKDIEEEIADHQTAPDTDVEPTEDAESMVDAPSDYPDEQSAPDVPGDFLSMEISAHWPNDAL